MGKGIKTEHMFRFMEDAKKAGTLIQGCFMLGFPQEDLESAEKFLSDNGTGMIITFDTLVVSEQ